MSEKQWIEGGKIAGEAREYGKTLIKEGASVLDVTKKIEAKITELGGALAFPICISINEVAAHYTARMNDDLCFGKDLVKLDVGAQKDGFLGDTAVTIDLDGSYTDFIKAAEAARDAAIKICVPGTTLGEIGRTVNETIGSFNLKTIKNLSGHGIAQYDAHVPPTIPNYDTKDPTELTEGQTIAIEPFVTDGVGLIESKGEPEIFNIREFKPLRMPFARNITNWVMEKYAFLPFSKRELLLNGFNETHIKLTIRQLKNLGAIEDHAPLVEKTNSWVAQAEHTLIVKDKPIITTKV